jgi:uncharacterized protein (DUF58 family)
MNSLITEKVVNTLDAFHLNVKEIVEGFMVGLHKSPYHGFSVEFADYRQYIPGDQIKDIDWKQYAKTDRYYVRRFEDETNVNAYILIDHSNSMSFSSHNILKLDYAKKLAASLTYLISKQNDAVGLVAYNDDISYWQPPKTNQAFLAGIYKKLYELKPEKMTDSIKVLHQIAEKIKKRSLIIIISDLLDDAEQLIKGFKHFRYLKHDVIVFHIVDDQEVEFNYKKETIFIDSESKSEVRVFPWQIRDNYQSKYSDFFQNIKDQCSSAKVEYVSFTTQTPLEDNLLKYLIKRSKL